MKKLELYKLGIVLEVLGGDKSLSALKDVDKQAGKTSASLKGLEIVRGLTPAITTIASVATGLGAALYGVAKEASDYGSMIYDAGQKTGFTTETLSALKFAADQSSSSFEEINAALPKFEKNLYAAARGNKDLAATFKTLGVDVREGLKSPEAAFSKFIAGFQRLDSDTQKAAIAQEVFGRSGAALIPTFNTIGNSLDDYKRKVGDLGLLLSEDAARQADEFGDKVDELTARIKGMGMVIGRAVIPEITHAIDSMGGTLDNNRDRWRSWGDYLASVLTGSKAYVDGLIMSVKTLGMVTPGMVINAEALAFQKRRQEREGHYTLDGQSSPAAVESGLAELRNLREKNRQLKARESGGVGDELLNEGRRAKETKKHADALASFRSIQERVSLTMANYGDHSEVAAVKQQFLSAGIEKLTGKLREQADAFMRVALIDAQLIDELKAKDAATAKAKNTQEQFNGVLQQQRDRLRDLEGGESEIQHVNRLLSDPTVAAAVDERTQSLLRLNAALILGKETTIKLNDQFVNLKGSLVEQARDLRQQIALMGVDNPVSKLRIQFDAEPLPKGMTNAQSIELVNLRRTLLGLTQQQYDLEKAQASDASYRQLLGELNQQAAVGVVISEQERISKLLLTDAYVGLTAAQRASLLVKAREIDLQKTQLQQHQQLIALLQQGAGFMPQQQVGKKRSFFGKLLGVAAPFLNFIPGIGPILSAGASIASSALQGDWRGALMGAAGGFASGGAFRGSAPLPPQTVNFTNPATGLPRRAKGGRVFGGRAYVIGEERAEVFTPDESGWIHPDAARYGGRTSGGGASGGVRGDKGGAWNHMIERMLAALEQNTQASAQLHQTTTQLHTRVESMRPGDVLGIGVKQNSRAIGDGMKDAMAKDARVTEWMTRRVNGQ